MSSCPLISAHCAPLCCFCAVRIVLKQQQRPYQKEAHLSPAHTRHFRLPSYCTKDTNFISFFLFSKCFWNRHPEKSLPIPKACKKFYVEHHKSYMIFQEVLNALKSFQELSGAIRSFQELIGALRCFQEISWASRSFQELYIVQNA